MTTLTRPHAPSFADLFTPKLITVLREGYGLAGLRADFVSGLTVAIVALPLSMAIAMASGTTPERGLYTAIVGGFFVSALGGSRYQIGGPAGAFIVLVAMTAEQHGLSGLLLATFLSGIFLAAIGLLRLGTYVKFIPYPVTVGFTAGIGVIIFSSQITDLLGLTLTVKEPAALIPKLQVLTGALSTISPSAFGVSLLTIVTIVGIKKVAPAWPNLLIAVALASVAVLVLGLPVETIGTRFGGIPSSLPAPVLPDLSPAKVMAVLPNAAAFAMLGAIESLLSAVVADGMTGRRHRSNCELVAQGVANMASAIFGGICVTGTIARTATNVRAGARSPVSGMLHSLFVLLFIVVAAPLASYIPLAALAGLLAVVSWNMVEKHAIGALLRSGWGDALVLLSTLLLTIFRDLTEGIVVGFTLGTLLFLHRMSQAVGVEAAPLAVEDEADADVPAPTGPQADSDTLIYRLSGAFFFGAASTVGAVLDSISRLPKRFVLDFSAVPFVDSTAAAMLESFAHKMQRAGVRVIVTGTTPAIRRVLWSHGLRSPLVRYRRTVDGPSRTGG
ncbi:SulP family inorganic anion transporter [Ancylobacter sp. MQZ15Z-1]|uniref:SulP family inorganic anion transporter n=1 Tax=Ancylobacter mangrovi TaxID=2972472 RepID=A0A9X2PF87_9HYPH|nr:SulP family inorganic anion transporter [Ancylobacter mangrovi]MCS0497621.1 SulP family inorganic anion transporter [Ancylobacter mangrovi]